jgi:outer membrane protein assembly factor BamB
MGLVLSAVNARAADGPPLEPAWIWQTQAGIEWAQTVGRDDTSAVLVATPTGVVHLVALRSGQPRPVLLASRGVRPAEGDDNRDIAYCFDRHAAYAIRLAEPAGLKWQFGRPVGMGEELQGDPERLAGWVHGHVTRDGLLLVDVDGRVVLLSALDGRPRWELQLDHLPLSRLHVWETEAAVLWKSGGAVRAAFLALDQETPQTICRELGDAWPVWSALVSEGLVTVVPQAAMLWARDGPVRVTRLDGVHVKAPAIAACPSAQGTRLLVGDGPQVRAYDLATGQARWHESAASVRGFKVLSLAIHEDRVVVTTEFGVSVRDAATGRLLGDCPLLPTIPVTAWWISGLEVLYVVSQVPGPPNVALRRVELPLTGAATAPAGTPSRRVDLRPGDEIRQVLWSGQQMVFVGPRELRAYRLTPFE